MYYTYVMRSLIDKRLYTGATGNLRRRFQEHNDGENFSTKNRRPFELIYYEACLSEADAYAREKYLKSGIGKRYVKNRLKHFFMRSGHGQ